MGILTSVCIVQRDSACLSVAESLLEFLDAQKSYRDTQLSYRNLVGSYLSSLAQLSLAVGQEVTP